MDKPFSFYDLGLAAAEFGLTFGGSVCIGVLIAGVCSLVSLY